MHRGGIWLGEHITMRKYDFYPPATCVNLIKDTKWCRIWRQDGWVYKQQHPYITDNESWMLERLADSRYVLKAKRVDEDTLAIEDLGDQEASWISITDTAAFMYHLPRVLSALHDAGIRHGDLTALAIIVVGNRPMLIDFAQSRLIGDPRPDKRPEGDKYWLTRTMRELSGYYKEQCG